ncbi:hypothetical protein J7E97_11665 [Streptomyces sp. ISL-66]|uniref:hypothetical protein n=1 Tax=Streptomyces sp. ISL-66 TaxID=2819186 RepID=UPI001BEC3218|nr:hypothetical protein [Streptomyces sp. ISL-66]MBT2468518.1 hypothetical protein [Streptomyces sp. ISL-66]
MAATAALALVPALGGCSSDGPKDGASPGATASPDSGASATASATASDGSGTPSATTATLSPGPSQSPTGPAPNPSASASASVPAPSGSEPDTGATLLAVTRSGGIAGKTSTLVIKGDGSFLRLDSKAVTVDRDKLSPAALAKLRTALRNADFPHLPRISMPDRPVIDAFTYAFRHDGYEVAAAQTTVPEPLQDVLAALPAFEPR